MRCLSAIAHWATADHGCFELWLSMDLPRTRSAVASADAGLWLTGAARTSILKTYQRGRD